jgi:hypothetical protein
MGHFEIWIRQHISIHLARAPRDRIVAVWAQSQTFLTVVLHCTEVSIQSTLWVRFGRADHAARAAGLPSIADSNGAPNSFGVGDHFPRLSACALASAKRLYDAIENGVADLADPMLKGRVAELKAIRDQAHADAERAEGALERVGPSITPQALKTFARQARKRMRTETGGYRRDYLRALAQRVEVDAKELRIMGSKSVLLRTLVAASGAKTAGFGVPSSVPKWRATS